MKDIRRRNEAKEAAERYAPNPQSSPVIYGFVAVSLSGLALVAFGRFYDIDVFEHPPFLMLVFAAVFVAGWLLQRMRTRRHVRAHRAEYQKSDTRQPKR